MAVLPTTDGSRRSPEKLRSIPDRHASECESLTNDKAERSFVLKVGLLGLIQEICESVHCALPLPASKQDVTPNVRRCQYETFILYYILYYQ